MLGISLNVTLGVTESLEVVLASGDEVTKTMAELNANKVATILQVRNMDGTQPCAYEVTLG